MFGIYEVIKYITILDIAYNIEVAKNLFNTNVFLKLKNIKATPNTPALNNEKPN